MTNTERSDECLSVSELHDMLESLFFMVLKRYLEIIVLDTSLTKEQRDEQLFPPFHMLTTSQGYNFVEASNIWNNLMAEIVIEHNLGMH
jgi:hypothetical protein